MKSINEMINYMGKFWDIDFDNSNYYFCYIFDFTKKDSNDFQMMISICIRKNRNYFFIKKFIIFKIQKILKN